jgi:hypothetical protein
MATCARFALPNWRRFASAVTEATVAPVAREWPASRARNRAAANKAARNFMLEASPPNVSDPVLILSADQFDRWNPLEHLYCPQPIDILQARFPKAIDHAHNIFEDIRKPAKEWASSDRAHVFDFEDGMRLIVSRDLADEEFIHVSASFRPLSLISKRLSPLMSAAFFQQEIIDNYLQPISNFVGEVTDRFIGDPPKRVFHLFFKEIR